MKKTVIYLIALIFVSAPLAFSKTSDESIAQAEDEQLKVEQPHKVEQPKKKVDLKKEEEKRAAIRKEVEIKKAELNGTSWDVEIKSNSGKGILSGKDTLTFQDERFRSQKAEKNGYAATNYTLTVQENGPTIWETMQTSKDGEATFWRGEWKEDVMSGVISRQITEGKQTSNEDYNFSSSSKKAVPKTSATEEEKVTTTSEKSVAPEEEAVLGGAAAPKQESSSEGSKSKKSWF